MSIAFCLLEDCMVFDLLYDAFFSEIIHLLQSKINYPQNKYNVIDFEFKISAMLSPHKIVITSKCHCNSIRSGLSHFPGSFHALLTSFNPKTKLFLVIKLNQ